MHLLANAIVCAVRAHGEHGAVARLLTPADGLQPGYVRGGHGRTLRPVLLPGNLVAAEYRARSEEQLASLTVELLHSRAGLFAEPLPAAAIEWVTALTATAIISRSVLLSPLSPSISSSAIIMKALSLALSKA